MHIPAPVTLITGSARGIGFELAQQFQDRGDKVHVVWRTDEDRGAELYEQFDARTHRCDLADPEQALLLGERIFQIDGKLDHVVHCVGDYHEAPLEDTEPEDWHALLQSNLMTSVHLMDGLREPMREQGFGSIVFLTCAGVSGYKARRKCAAYAAAKSALHSYARSLAITEAPHGIRVNTIAPGLIPHEDAHAATRDPALQEAVPMGRAGTLDDVAHAAVWLSSPHSSYAVGVELCVSGGWLM